MERVLFIWAIRHPASGYVQGLNDLICPFMMVFFSEHVRHGEKFENIDITEVAEEAFKQVYKETIINYSIVLIPGRSRLFLVSWMASRRYTRQLYFCSTGNSAPGGAIGRFNRPNTA